MCGPALSPREQDPPLAPFSPSMRLTITEACFLPGRPRALVEPMTPTWWTYNSWYVYDHQYMYMFESLLRLTQEWSKLDLDGGPVPVERSDHASCCINVGDDHPLLLVTGGLDKDYRVLKDAWLLDIVARRWTEVYRYNYSTRLCVLNYSSICHLSMQLTGHWSFQPRFNHSLTATSLAPGITVVTSFGGAKKWGINRIAETALLQFGKCQSISKFCATVFFIICTFSSVLSRERSRPLETH